MEDRLTLAAAQAAVRAYRGHSIVKRLKDGIVLAASPLSERSGILPGLPVPDTIVRSFMDEAYEAAYDTKEPISVFAPLVPALDWDEETMGPYPDGKVEHRAMPVFCNPDSMRISALAGRIIVPEPARRMPKMPKIRKAHVVGAVTAAAAVGAASLVDGADMSDALLVTAALVPGATVGDVVRLDRVREALLATFAEQGDRLVARLAGGSSARSDRPVGRTLPSGTKSGPA